MRSLFAVLALIFICFVQADLQDRVDAERDIFHVRNVNDSDPSTTSGSDTGADSGPVQSTSTDPGTGATPPPGSSVTSADEFGSDSSNSTETSTGSTPPPGSCPAPVERCCTRVMNNPKATLRVNTRTPEATLTSIYVWNDAPGGAPLLPAGGGPASSPEVAVGASGAMSWCVVGHPLVNSTMPGYAGLSLSCPTSGEILTLAFHDLLAPSSPPGRLAIRMCTVVPDNSGGAPQRSGSSKGGTSRTRPPPTSSAARAQVESRATRSKQDAFLCIETSITLVVCDSRAPAAPSLALVRRRLSQAVARSRGRSVCGGGRCELERARHEIMRPPSDDYVFRLVFISSLIS